MKISKKARNIVVTQGKKETTLLLTTSVAFYKSKIFKKAFRWKVIEDASMTRELINKALASQSKEDIDAVMKMETFYKSIIGVVDTKMSKKLTNAIREERYSAEKDVMALGDREPSKDGVSKDIITLLDEANLIIPLGDLVELKKQVNGKARNAYRTKKRKT